MNTFVYDVSSMIGQLIARVFHGWHVESGLENVPSGPFVLAANHEGIIDPWLVASPLGRRVAFMAKTELFDIPVVKWWLRAVGSFPVRRGEPDRTAIRHALQVLKEGGVVAIFVEGTRNPQGLPLPIQPGAAMLAVRANVPILPVVMARRGRRKVTRIGRPIMPPASFEGRARDVYQMVSEQVARAIDELKEGPVTKADAPSAPKRPSVLSAPVAAGKGASSADVPSSALDRTPPAS